MRVIRECDRIDYMLSIPLHEFFVGEDVVVDCGKFVYIAHISKISMQTLGLYPVQQTDFERYEFDSRVIKLQRPDVCGIPATVSYGLDGLNHTHSYDSYGSEPYPLAPPEPQQEPQIHIWNESPARWRDAPTLREAVERTSEHEREDGFLHRIYNRIGRILMTEL